MDEAKSQQGRKNGIGSAVYHIRVKVLSDPDGWVQGQLDVRVRNLVKSLVENQVESQVYDRVGRQVMRQLSEAVHG